MSACAFPESVELTAQCARVANLILANPKNSAASAWFALRSAKDHVFAKRMNAFDGIATRKAVDPMILLTLDWLALRGVLNKAATQGDVAAIPDALAWAELAYAKIPNKPSDVIAADAEIDLKFDAVPPPAKSSGGCSPDVDEIIDPTVVEFKN